MNLNIQGIMHIFPKNGHPGRPVLKDIHLEIGSGEFAAIIGPSGCGKSTLLRLIANLLHPTSGSIEIDGESPERAVAERRIAWMSQSPALLPWMTARENVSLAGRFHHRRSCPLLEPEDALQRVGLGKSLDAYPHTLSGGMQQRLALARTLMLDADLWLMDEPFASLDELTRERLTQELIAIWQPLRPTVMWVTHNIYEAVRLADRVLVMSAAPGKLVLDLPVRIPHPRRETSAGFQELITELRAVLEETAEEELRCDG
jgi:NitT/TauT family transport system ATP-binding protein